MDSTAARAGTTSAVQSALDAAHRERDEVVRRLEEVDQLIPRLERVVDGHGGTAGGTTATARRGRPPAGEMSRSDRVVQVVAESDQPLTTGEVRSRLRQDEPEVSSKVVSASLSYAQRRGRIRRNADNRWVAAAA